MMLRYSLDYATLADDIENAVGRVLDKGLRTTDIMAEGCRQVGTVELGGKGCMCPEGAVLKALMQHLLLRVPRPLHQGEASFLLEQVL